MIADVVPSNRKKIVSKVVFAEHQFTCKNVFAVFFTCDVSMLNAAYPWSTTVPVNILSHVWHFTVTNSRNSAMFNWYVSWHSADFHQQATLNGL